MRGACSKNIERPSGISVDLDRIDPAIKLLEPFYGFMCFFQKDHPQFALFILPEVTYLGF